MKKFGSSLVGGAKAVASAQKSVAGAVVEGGKSAYSSVVDAKGDPSSRCSLACHHLPRSPAQLSLECLPLASPQVLRDGQGGGGLQGPARPR